MKPGRLLPLLVLVSALLLLPAAAYAAAEPDEVAAEVADTGFFVAPGADVSATRVGDLVATVRNAGERMSFVVLAESPPSGATTFADAVVDRLGVGVVLVLTPEDVGVSGRTEQFTDDEIDAALDEALDTPSDLAFLEAFVAALTGDTTPVDAGTGAASDGGGGGGGFLLWLVLIGAALVVFFVWRARRSSTRAPRIDTRLATAKAEVQRQIDAVANDLIDMEDEVRVADNEQADDYYEAAARTYGEVTEAFDGAVTPEAVLDLANRLDEAIWQLDSAEAVLDGKPAPSRPRPRSLPSPGSPPTGVPTPSGSDTLPPRPSYDRRPSRRSGYSGSGLVDMLIGVAGAMMVGRSRRSRGGMFGRSTVRPPSVRFPSLGRSSRSSPSSSRSSSASRSRRSGRTGSIRTGRRRRRG